MGLLEIRGTQDLVFLLGERAFQAQKPCIFLLVHGRMTVQDRACQGLDQ